MVSRPHLILFSVIVQQMAVLKRRYQLEKTQRLSSQVYHCVFSTEDGAPFSFIPGQFVTLHLQGPDKIAHRSYSIANQPQGNRLELSFAYVEGGLASQYLCGLQPGDCIEASGPHGLLVLKEEKPARILLVGTGTGIAPYRSMLEQISDRLQQDPALEIVVIQGTRQAEDLLFLDDFVAFDKAHPNFHFYACYSRATQTQHDFEHLGRVQTLLEKLGPNPTQDLIYLCGNPNMIDDNFALLTEIGFDKKSIRREKYAFSH